jgi:hypothetical protein
MLPSRDSGQECANSAGASTSNKRSRTDTFKVPEDAVWQHFEIKDKDQSNNFLAVCKYCTDGKILSLKAERAKARLGHVAGKGIAPFSTFHRGQSPICAES